MMEWYSYTHSDGTKDTAARYAFSGMHLIQHHTDAELINQLTLASESGIIPSERELLYRQAMEDLLS